jgi:hypothetical protein
LPLAARLRTYFSRPAMSMPFNSEDRLDGDDLAIGA